jgi:amidase
MGDTARVNQAAPAYRVPRHRHRYDFSPEATPVLRVPSGAAVTLETLDCFSNRVTSAAQRYRAEDQLLAEIGAYNPVAGPVYVEGAEPGDVLAVTIDDIRLGTAAPFAVTVTFGAGSRYVTAPCPGIPSHGDTKICRIDGADVIFPVTGGEMRLPGRPMVGTIGTAPAAGPVPSLGYGQDYGGNMDCPLVTTGSVLYLPVNVPGALLSLGDVHALMGDAEITGTALETSGDVVITVTVLPAGTRRLTLPHLDTGELIGAIGCRAGATVQANLEAAVLEMHRRLTGEYGLAAADAYQLLGATARVLVDQCVAPPTWSAVHVGVPRPRRTG